MRPPAATGYRESDGAPRTHRAAASALRAVGREDIPEAGDTAMIDEIRASLDADTADRPVRSRHPIFEEKRPGSSVPHALRLEPERR